MRTISMICWKRQEYLQKAVESVLGNCAIKEFDEFHIFTDFRSDHRVIQYLQTLSPDQIKLVVHSAQAPMGVDANGFWALKHVFEEVGSDLNVHVEEDVIISPDALKFVIEKSQESMLGSMCICLHNHGGSQMVSQSDLNFWKHWYHHGFNPYGWACTKEQWSFIRDEWFTNRWTIRGKRQVGWDWSLNYHCEFTRNMVTLQPVVSRATTIGEFGGVNMTPEQWRADFSKQEIVR